MATTYYGLPTLQNVQGDIGDCLEDLLVEDSGNSGIETIDTTLHNHEQNINKLSGVVETFSVSSWTADGTISPYTYKATVTLVTTLTNETIVELINDNALLFAQHGFAIGDITNQVVTIYSIGEPESTVSISIRIGGVLSNSGGGSGGTTLNRYVLEETTKSQALGKRIMNILLNAKSVSLAVISVNYNSQYYNIPLTGIPYTNDNVTYGMDISTFCKLRGGVASQGGTFSANIWPDGTINTAYVAWTSTTGSSTTFTKAYIVYYNDTEITQ